MHQSGIVSTFYLMVPIIVLAAWIDMNYSTTSFRSSCMLRCTLKIAKPVKRGDGFGKSAVQCCVLFQCKKVLQNMDKNKAIRCIPYRTILTCATIFLKCLILLWDTWRTHHRVCHGRWFFSTKSKQVSQPHLGITGILIIHQVVHVVTLLLYSSVSCVHNGCGFCQVKF